MQEIVGLEVQGQQDVLQPLNTFLHLPQVLRTGCISYMTLYGGWSSLWIMLNAGFCLK